MVLLDQLIPLLIKDLPPTPQFFPGDLPGCIIKQRREKDNEDQFRFNMQSRNSRYKADQQPASDKKYWISNPHLVGQRDQQ
jgi:hypothetical protein